MAARFFCDNCGTEVKRDSGRCPKCGRYFAFVRCPQCDYIGEESNFTRGCPVCGYCAEGREKPAARAENKPPLRPAGKLPLWVYLAAFSGLLLVALALYLIIK